MSIAEDIYIALMEQLDDLDEEKDNIKMSVNDGLISASEAAALVRNVDAERAIVQTELDKF